MSRIIYQDDLITEFDDGTEEVRFTDAEWAMMMEDPVRFGYACPSGHAWSDSEREHDHCHTCVAAQEADHDDEIDVAEVFTQEVVETFEAEPRDPEETDGEDIPF